MSEGLREKIADLLLQEKYGHTLSKLREVSNDTFMNDRARVGYKANIDWAFWLVDVILTQLQQTIEQNTILVSLFRAISTATGDRGNVDKCLKTFKEWKEKASLYDKMFEGLVVEDECPTCTARGLRSHFGKDCPTCNGTGTISRPLTEEEKVELAEILVNRGWTSEINGIGELISKQFIILPSGKRVVRK